VTNSLPIQPVDRPVVGRIRPPGSKSITNRALICAALADGPSLLRGALDSDDTRVMIDALRQVGLQVEHDREAKTIQIVGCGGKIPATEAELYIGNSGTTVRFLTAFLALGHGKFRLHGTPRMHQRPIQDLIDALAALGCRAVSETDNGCPPVIVDAQGLRGGATSVRSDVSSQFLSGLLMAAPYAESPITLTVGDALVSKPYVTMTLDVMRAFGAALGDAGRDLRQIAIPTTRYQPRDYEIEPDASAASYFFATAAITGGEVTVEGLTRRALQGDVQFVNVLEQMGCTVRESADGLTLCGPERLRGIDVDMNAVSDTVQTLAVAALFADGPTRVRGVAHNRHKETDRIAAPAVELRKLGATVEEHDDGLTIIPPAAGLKGLHGAEIDTYDDHRMAMSFALTGLKVPGVVIRDPGCTSKTYPEFFVDLGRLTGKTYEPIAQ
jgi:3-phosphoshikimate 1-carboxyvinyltransferase